MLSNSSRPQCVAKAKQHATWAMIFIRQDNELLDCFASQYSLCAKWTINTQYLNSACYKLKRRRISACEKNYIFAILNGNIFINVTSSWARWRLKSPALWLFTRPIIQAQIKENIKSSASLAFVCGIHRWPVNSPPPPRPPHKWPVTRKMLPFDGVIMYKCKHPRSTEGDPMGLQMGTWTFSIHP